MGVLLGGLDRRTICGLTVPGETVLRPQEAVHTRALFGHHALGCQLPQRFPDIYSPFPHFCLWATHKGFYGAGPAHSLTTCGVSLAGRSRGHKYSSSPLHVLCSVRRRMHHAQDMCAYALGDNEA